MQNLAYKYFAYANLRAKYFQHILAVNLENVYYELVVVNAD